MATFKFLYGLFFLCMANYLTAEVEQVTLKWNPIPCTHECPRLLQDRLAKAKGVASVEMHAEMGNAVMVWDKKIPFSFVPLNWALRYVGVREKGLFVKVSGYLKGAGAQWTLTSRGDNTVFVLFNRAVPVNPPQYINLYNPTNRVLTPDLVAKLEEAKRSNQVVVIEGPIFMPERSPPDPLRLVVDNVSVETQKTPPKPQQKVPARTGSFGTGTPAK